MSQRRDERPRDRDAQGPRWVLGVQASREAIRVHGAAIARVCVERRRGEPGPVEGIAKMARDRGLRVEVVDRSALDKIAAGGLHQGVAVEAPPLAIASLEAIAVDATRAAPTLLIALDELTDPHNFGAIVRSAVALGAHGVVWPEDKSAPLSMAMTRASAGAVEHATLCRVTSLPRALGELRDAGVAVVGLDASGDRAIGEVDLRRPTCLVVGSEGKGLRRATKTACETLVRLPMPGPIDSLNASVAAAIALYEVVRQRETR
jgi:23S rRNA (guanosine2251-2'-O)-methyltransferase